MVQANKSKEAIQKFVFGSHVSFRKVTVYARPSEARGKAVDLLDKRCMKSGGEPPVSWDLFEIKQDT